jgi:hypothetical protein
MFKILALFVLIWIFIKAVGTVLKMVIGGSTNTNKHTRYSNSSGHRPKGDINVDHDPNKSSKGYEGGEYVDYEDVD